MALVKISDFYPNYKEEVFGGYSIKGTDVYAGTSNDKIGTVEDVLLDENGHFRYLVIDTGFWVFGKNVLLPIGSARIDYSADRVYALGLANKDQAEELPAYDSDMTVDYDYEERVRGVYRKSPTATTSTPATASSYDRDTYHYDREPELYSLRDDDHKNLKLYEEKLVANKDRYKSGSVAVGKRVETETARASVPVEKERVVIERTNGNGREVEPGAAKFNEGEVARADLYEETANIDKKAYVRENVNVRKETERDTVDASEKIRREELDVDKKGNPVVRNRR